MDLAPTLTPSLEVLFERYRHRGDSGSIEQIYARTGARLRLVAAFLCDDPADVDDAVQATFAAALESARSWDDDRPLWPWLVGILHNWVRRVRRARGNSVEPERMRLNDRADPLIEVEVREFLAAVRRGVAGLPQPYRAVVEQRLIEGATPAQIAVRLSRPAGRVRVQLSRGLEMLRRNLPAGFAAALAAAFWAQPAAAAATPNGANGEALRGVESSQLRAVRRTTIGVAAVGATIALVSVLLPPAESPPGVVRFARVADPVSAAESAVGGGWRRRVAIAAPTAVAAGSTGLLLRVARDGAPAPSVPVRLEALADDALHWVARIEDRWGPRQLVQPTTSRPAQAPCAGTTDARGELRMEGLRAGRWLLRLPGQTREIEIVGNELATVEVALAADVVAVHGVVVADAGPVAGAVLWAAPDPDRIPCERLGVCSPDGAFTTYVRRGGYVMVRAPGYRAAVFQVADGGQQVVSLLAGAGRLEGVVVDARGRPRPGAIVQVGSVIDTVAAASSVELSAGAHVRGAAPIRLRTDAEGRFAVDALAPGRVRVEAAEGASGVATAEVEITAGARARTTLSLPVCAEVSGVVVDESGAPVPSARVVIGRPWLELGYVAARTDAAGRYALRGVTPGTHRVSATSADGGSRALGSVVVDSGGHATWRAKLSRSYRRLHGRVVGWHGRAEDWLVQRAAGRLTERAILQADGSFAFAVEGTEAERTWTLSVYPRDGIRDGEPVSLPLAVARGALPGGDGIELQVAGRHQRTAGLRGVAHLVQSRAPMPIYLVHRDWGRLRLGVVGAGERLPLELEALPEGTCWLEAGSGGGRSRPFELRGAQVHDAGTVELLAVAPEGGQRRMFRRVLQFLHPGTAAPFGPLDVSLRGSQGGVLRFTVEPYLSAWQAALELEVDEYVVEVVSAHGYGAAHRLVVEPVDASYGEVVPLARLSGLTPIATRW